MPVVKRYLFLVFLLIVALPFAKAQIQISSFTTHTQNFNSLASGTWVNNTTATGWYVAVNGTTPSAIIAANGSSAIPGLKAYGSAASERALGVVNTASGYTYYGVRLKNNTGTTIKRFSVSYTLELWAKPNGNKKVDISFRSQIGASDLTSGTWVAQPAGAISRRAGSGHSKALDGNLATNRTTVTFNTSDINLAPGAEVILRWSDLNTTGAYCAIDDFSVTASNATVFYSKSSGNLTSLSTWGLNPNGSGTTPLLFDNATFIIANRTTTTLTTNWVIGALGKVILSEGTLVVPATYFLSGKIDVAGNTVLDIANNVMPTFGTIHDDSNIILSGSGTQILPLASYSNLTIAGGGLKLLSANTNIRNSLTFINGKVRLGNYNLNMVLGADIFGANETSFIVTNGTGSLVQEVAGDNTEVLFPVGTTSYLPVRLSQPLSETIATDNFKVRASDKIYKTYNNNLPAGDLITSQAINKTWIIDEEVAGGSNVTLTLGWRATDATSDFNFRQARIKHFYDGAWDDFTNTGATFQNGFYFVSRSGITSFSPFGSFSDPYTTLPVELISFTARRESGSVVCQWTTASEVNNHFFTVERSLNGREFVAVGNVNGAGNTNTMRKYAFRDENAPAGLIYYRLKQTDFDGTATYSKVVTISGDRAVNTYSLYPNPAAETQFIKAVAVSNNPVTIIIRSTQGGEVSKYRIEGTQLQQGFELNLATLAKGLYLVEVLNGTEKTVLKSIKN